MVTTRVCFAMGASQIFFLASAIHEEARLTSGKHDDYLVLYGFHLSPERKDVMDLMAKHSWSWKAIVWADDLLDYDVLRAGIDFQNLIPLLRQRITVSNADQIWVCRLSGRPEQAVMAAFPEAEIVFCEDGLGSYSDDPPFPRILLHPKKISRKLWYKGLGLLREWPRFQVSRFNRWPVKPIARSYLLLLNLIPVPRHLTGTPVQVIDASTARAVINRVRKAVELYSGIPETQSTNDGNVLVLGQYFHDDHIMDWEHELRIYVRVCIQLVERGFTVIWKEHPKNPRPFSVELSKLVPQIVTLSQSKHNLFPVEFLVPECRLKACVSAASTALFTISYIYGVPAYNFSSEISIYLKGPSSEMGSIVLQVTDPLDKLLNSQKSIST